MTRRKFLQIVAVCGAALAAGWVATRDVFGSLVDRVSARLLAVALSPERRVHAHFHYLDLDPSGVRQYLADYQLHQRRFSRYSPFPSDVYLRYLLSTDFFRRAADEHRPVAYVAFYDPYVTPCNNPLADVDLT